jgi:SAM-dependent MidA family methyltransferase
MGPLTAELTELLRAELRSAGALTFARFMELALYAPRLGYYRRDRPRVGRGPGTDFYTATSSGPLFGQLVSAACVQLLGAEDPANYTWVEIGAEPGGGILREVFHPFGGIRTIGVGEPIRLEGRCIVFSNELFDAQPFHRYRFRAGAWREIGVALAPGERNAAGSEASPQAPMIAVDLPGIDPRTAGSGDRPELALQEVELPVATPTPLPASAPEGYVVDAPLGAVALARELTAQPWTGLFVAFDYGRTWAALTEEYPEGTARAYHRHTQSNDLLARPGEQDLTCHICWDWLVEVLAERGFDRPHVESQEAFFTLRASDFIAAAVAANATRLSRDKLALMQLLHPAHLGQKFQVLHALRPSLPLPPAIADR